MIKAGATWWSSRFLRSLERLGLSSKLHKGREFLKEGHQLRLEVSTSGVSARVTDKKEYLCRIEFAPLTDWEWEESLERLAFQDLSAAALLVTGRLPPHIEDFFTPVGRRLLPSQNRDLELFCSCRAPSLPCQHLAASAYAFAEQLDKDPWLLFLVRGRSAQSIKTSLSERWNRGLDGVMQAEDKSSLNLIEPLTKDIDLFWGGALSCDPSWDISDEKAYPTIDRLGVPEPKVDHKLWQEVLNEFYSCLAKRARCLYDESQGKD